MLSWAVTFLVIGLIAGVLGVTGVAGTATHIAYVPVRDLSDFGRDRHGDGPTPASSVTRANCSSSGSHGAHNESVELAGGPFFGDKDRAPGLQHGFFLICRSFWTERPITTTSGCSL